MSRPPPYFLIFFEIYIQHMHLCSNSKIVGIAGALAIIKTTTKTRTVSAFCSTKLAPRFP